MTNKPIALVGPTGSGIHTAITEMEGLGYQTIIPTLLRDLKNVNKPSEQCLYLPRIQSAIIENVSLDKMKDYFTEVYSELQRLDCTIISLDADDGVLIKRQDRSNLPPPLSTKYHFTTMESLIKEKDILSPIMRQAVFRFDTSNASQLECRRAINLALTLGITNYRTNNYIDLLEHCIANFGNLFSNLDIIKEIYSQPDAINDVVKKSSFIKAKIETEVTARFNLATAKGLNKRVVLVGEGSSLFALDSARWLVHKGFGKIIHTDLIPASELRLTKLDNSIVIICSNSGETGEIKTGINEGRFESADLVIGMTNYPDSTLGKYANEKGILFALETPEEKSIPSTVSMLKSILIGTAILLLIGEIPNDSKLYNSFISDIASIPSKLNQFMNQTTIHSIYRLSQYMWQSLLADFPNIKSLENLKKIGYGYITGAGIQSSCLLSEISLKAKELAKIHLQPIYNSIFHGPFNADVSLVVYLQDFFLPKDVMKKQVDRMRLYAPVVTIGSNDLDVPGVIIPSSSPTETLVFTLITMQICLIMVGLLNYESLQEIQNPIRLSKVVVDSPM